MVLIDAIYINYGGGLGLLRYLIDSLEKESIDFYMLQDARIPNEFDNVAKKSIVQPTLKARKNAYKRIKEDVTSVFCFGNVPPPIKFSVPVYTYFHNINLLRIPDTYTFITKITCILKREYIRLLSKNTDKWIVQTANTCKEIKRAYNLKDDDVKIIPFYNIPKFTKGNKGEKERKDYIFVGDLSNAKGHDVLIRAWEYLHNIGIRPTLHLTVDFHHEEFVKEIHAVTQKGVKIINHGCIPFDKVVELYQACKAIVYPSLNESLGLGLIEAIEYGCDVIASDLPYTYSICKPSIVFDPTDYKSIVQAIEKYETTAAEKSVLTTNNKIKDLVSLLK